MSTWAKALEAAGGAERAMLHGAPLRDLLAELERVERELKDREAWLTLHEEQEQGVRVELSEARRLLEAERAALVKLQAEIEPDRKQLAAALEVVDAANDGRAWVLERVLKRYNATQRGECPTEGQT